MDRAREDALDRLSDPKLGVSEKSLQGEAAQPVSLSMLYLDNKTNRRWALQNEWNRWRRIED
jgi:hypothetical protein